MPGRPTLGSWNLENPCSNLSLLYQDEDVVVVHKPSGLLVHRSMIDARETQFALQILRDQLGQYVYPVHRLDKATSGALVFALNKPAAQSLTGAFAQGGIIKTYWALVRGWLKAPVNLDYPLSPIIENRTKTDSNKEEREALTRFNPLEFYEVPVAVDRYPSSRYCLLEAMPETGRRHQIRRHLVHLRHPILGDVTYGVGKHNRFFREHFQTHRLLLAARSLSFTHPNSGQPLTVSCPLESNFASCLQQLKQSYRIESEFTIP